MSEAYMFDAQGPFAITDNDVVQRALAARGIQRFEITVPLDQDVSYRIRIYSESPPAVKDVKRLVASVALHEKRAPEVQRTPVSGR